jgi:hypothetical protein
MNNNNKSKFLINFDYGNDARDSSRLVISRRNKLSDDIGRLFEGCIEKKSIAFRLWGAVLIAGNGSVTELETVGGVRGTC